jgi:signal peptide peptidase-like protein 2B
MSLYHLSYFNLNLIILAMFAIGAFTSLTKCLNRLSYFVPLLRRYKTPSHICRKPCTCKLGPLNAITVFAMAISLTLVIIWYIYRLSDWAWILQDILGAAVCISVLSAYRVGNMRVITIILIVFFLYDIFFVFVTPHIPFFQSSNDSTTATAAPSSGSSSGQTMSRQPPKNPSVMEQVALGIGTNGESVPLLFALPVSIPESELDSCVALRKSMLGFGDVILPVNNFEFLYF